MGASPFAVQFRHDVMVAALAAGFVAHRRNGLTPEGAFSAAMNDASELGQLALAWYLAIPGPEPGAAALSAVTP